MASNSQSIYKSMALLYKLKVKEFFRRKELTLLSVPGSRRFWHSLNNFHIPPIECDGVHACDDLDKADMFSECFLAVYKLGGGSEPVFYGSISNALGDVLFDVPDDYNILCNINDRFALTPNGIPSMLFRK